MKECMKSDKMAPLALKSMIAEEEMKNEKIADEGNEAYNGQIPSASTLRMRKAHGWKERGSASVQCVRVCSTCPSSDLHLVDHGYM